MDVLSVRVMSPKQVHWEGKAQAVAAVNSLGPFSLLPGHANFVSVIEGDVTIYSTDERGAKTVPGGHGVMFCRDNRLEVFIQLPLGRDQTRFWQ